VVAASYLLDRRLASCTKVKIKRPKRRDASLLTWATFQAFLLDKMIELIGAIAGMRRSSEPNWLLACLTPHVPTIRQRTRNILGVVVLLLVDEGGSLTAERISSVNLSPQD
jgi:hypothetical protein